MPVPPQISDQGSVGKSKNNKPAVIPVGQVQFSIGVQIPVAAFLLSLTIAVLVSFLFYFETQRLLTKQTTNELAIESSLVEPMIEQFYQQAKANVLFLSKIPSVLDLLNAINEQDIENQKASRQQLEEVFSEFVNSQPFYYQVRYIGITDIGRELVNVRGDNQINVTPQSDLQIKKHRPYFQASINIPQGTVYFSKIELAKNHRKIEVPHKPVLRVSTPVYNPKTGASFGIIVININFYAFIKQLETEALKELSFYLANTEGDYIFHPDKNKTFGFDLGKRHLMQTEFPALASAFNSNTHKMNLVLTQDDSLFIGHFKQLSFENVGSKRTLNLLVLKNKSVIEKTLQDFRSHSLLLGSVLAFIALTIAIFAAKRIARPLKQITQSLTTYDNSGQLGELPLSSKSEIGVLARSFSNLFKTVRHALHEQQESALLAKQSLEKLNAVFASAAEAFITINDKGIITSFNRAAETMFGYTETEILSKNINILMPENHAIHHDNYINQYVNTGKSSIVNVDDRKLSATKKSGETFPIHLAISKTKTEYGYVFTGIIRDISKETQLELEQERNQLALMAINERMTLATDAAGIGIWQYDLLNDQLSWDHWMFKLYDVDTKDFTGTINDWKNSVHKMDLEAATNAIEQAIRTGGTFDHEFRIVHSNGEIKHIKAIAIAKCNNQGEAIKVIGVNFDITNRKEVELEHIAAKELAENTVRHKAEFLASMSHEIRTPMNGILGMLGLLMRNELNDEQLHRVQLANSSAKALLYLINDILDFSKVDAGKLDLEEIDFDLRQLFGEFSESFALKSQEKNIEIILDNKAITQSHVIGDPGRIRQILNNLIGNAIKFTDHGEIVITAALIKPINEEQNGQDEEQLILECSIKDTGIGIPEDKVSTLFDSFTQVDASTTRKYGGTGLGLAISKQLCQLMHGEISVSSTLNKGSTFSFKVKLKPSQQTTKVLPSVSIENVAMLVVDDNTTNRTVLREQLESWGAKVNEAIDGLDALDLLENKFSEQQVSDIKIAFLDMNMPNMDGATLAKAIKKNKTLTHIKLVMMTSMSSRGDAKYFSQLGFCAYFPKPAITNDLFKALKLCLSPETDNSELPLITHYSLEEYQDDKSSPKQDSNKDGIPQNTSTLQGCRLLLVEDNRINQEVARHVLSEFGITPEIANNGREALECLQEESNPEKPFEVILMDCQMPEMDGYQATQAIRQGEAGEKYQNIIIIAMTANAMKGDKEKCLNSGMTDYLSKPIEPAKLKDKLTHYLCDYEVITEQHSPSSTNLSKGIPVSKAQHHKEANAIKSAKKIVEKKLPEETNNADTAEEVALWNKGDFAKRLNNNEMIQQKLLQLFIDEMPKQLTALSLTIEQGDMQEAHNVNHKIQGMSANISAIRLTECCKRLAGFSKLSNIKSVQEEHEEIKSLYPQLELLLKEQLSLFNSNEG